MASQPKNTLPIAAVFSNLFRNIPRLVLLNLIFAVPLGAVFSLLWLLVSALDPEYNIRLLMMLLTVPLSYPFFSGIVRITSKMSAGEEKVEIFRNYFHTVRENFLRFLVHGIVLYVAVIVSYYSLSLYIKLVSQNAVFFGPLLISIIVMVCFCFMFFYIPLLTVTFEMPMKNIYKNSLLMSYGELKKNFIGLFGLFCVSVIAMTFLIACYGSSLAVIIVTIAVMALYLPSFSCFIVNAAVYERMYEMVTNKNARSQKLDEKINAEKQKRIKQEQKDEFKQRLIEFEIDENVSDDEYIYFNGRMVKKRVLVKMKQEALESEE